MLKKCLSGLEIYADYAKNIFAAFSACADFGVKNIKRLWESFHRLSNRNLKKVLKVLCPEVSTTKIIDGHVVSEIY